jgi:preprotein translocase subunit SecA
MMRHLERMVLLQVVDTRWKDHLYAMDNLREGIGLRACGQRDPLVEYQHEAYAMFQEMVFRIKEETLEFLFKIRAASEEVRPTQGVFDFSRQQMRHDESAQFQYVPQGGRRDEGAEAPAYEALAPEPKQEPYKRETPKVGRNDPCPCGSGKKYKKCCGK